MRTRKKVAIVVAFALMAILAKPQISFAQAPPAPVVFGFLGGLIGTGMGSVISGRTKRELIYETK